MQSMASFKGSHDANTRYEFRELEGIPNCLVLYVVCVDRSLSKVLHRIRIQNM